MKGPAMIPYEDIDNDSNVAAYEIGAGMIRVQFKDGSIYRYTNSSAGAENIRQMIQLARSGDGLNSFINKYVRDGYEAKER